MHGPILRYHIFIFFHSFICCWLVGVSFLSIYSFYLFIYLFIYLFFILFIYFYFSVRALALLRDKETNITC